MATLPRMHNSRHGIGLTPVSTPFSTSPRKLQEVTLPAPEMHDLTTSSGISMKQFEEQLSGLRKENFHLKLRIYFLEEKLGSGAPPAVQGLLEHNVRLQVEVEELRRQLSDKQELLAAAAEAIDVLEQQGSMSADSIETSMNNSSLKKEVVNQMQNTVAKEITEDTYAESESAGEFLGVTVNKSDLDELAKLRKENTKALQMIKACMKKIQQQDKEIKKQKLDKELVYAHVSDSQLEKYEEILKCKDEHIKDLEHKIRDLQKSFENDQADAAGNLQELLTRRLQGLAYFLDKLLSHKCVLGEDKKKLAESILEQSLALPVGLKLDESMALEDFTMDESNLDMSQMSQSLRMEDLTLMFGHHMACSDDNVRTRKPHKVIPQADAMSDSECWSEPDRNVSLARVGICDMGVAVRESTCDNNKYRARRSRVSYGSRSEDKVRSDTVLLEEISKVAKRTEELEEERNDLHNKLETAEKHIGELIAEKEQLRETVTCQNSKLSETTKDLEIMKNSVSVMESKVKDVEHQLAEATHTMERLRYERQELESTFLETERSLRRAADEATVQASQAALERARAQHDRLRIERELEEARDRLSTVLEKNAQLEIEVTKKVGEEANNKLAVLHEGLPSEDERPTSPDQGIDSDRLSSLEQNDAVALSPRTLYEENVTLKQKLARTKTTLADTLAQLNAANMRKRSVQRAICREIHKTHGVLRKARDQFENPN